ncbi:DUF2244 domain-containing protein [Defluviimonas sp. WL0002]|uniref:DUF2244 domain-containing protein n=1 Tax=Albidovulum marisflavi TaxID=2984159 RepID=A0ABT2ZET8_9RHOB|nr:DUF2244 domain-containing protein [Defluviimonas sp. WL0002]MCV2869621.1 DUF2244 domain-containing protein [Defluviimonas sp. WL0002]
MPYEWIHPEASGENPAELHLWPYRSLGPRGFAVFIGATVLMLSIPLFSVLGTVILWVLLPFMIAAVAGMWWALGRSWRDARLTEVLTIATDRVAIRRQDPDGRLRDWEANPYWTSVHLQPTGGPVAQYLTLKGGGREVELGAFLTPGERAELAQELRKKLGEFR